MLKRRILSLLLAVCMLLSVTGCTSQSTKPSEDSFAGNVESERKLLIQSSEDLYDASLKPSVPTYTVEQDFSNVINFEQFSYLSEDVLLKLLENGFAVVDGYDDEFYSIYEMNRYMLTPNFITVDSMMHTYHLFFSRILKGIETESFIPALTDISEKMRDDSLAQYETLKGTEWENAALRNAAFFSVGLSLLKPGTDVSAEVKDVAAQELSLIDSAAGIAQSPLMNMGGSKEGLIPIEEDYSQYIPRGYYTTSEDLARYFKAMMWYGRMSFRQADEDQSKSALLMTIAAENNAEVMTQWEKIYTVTGFFVGSSDDPGVWEYAPAARVVYGELPEVSKLPDLQNEWQSFLKAISEMKSPAINSIPIYDETIQEDKDEAIKAFRFMGQRAVLDAEVFQKLVYREVKEDPSGNTRMLPSALDIPSALGSKAAAEILSAAGEDKYEGYTENMTELRDYFSSAPQTLWNGTLYNGWINTLRPLTEEKGEGYPLFMQNKSWTIKNLSSFLGSWTELKHDTILYAKQSYAEMGGDDAEEMDDRGYVEPEPVIYSRLVSLIRATSEGLSGYGVLNETDAENLKLMEELALKLLTISEKELTNQSLDESEHELIRTFGGQLEHFWYEALKGEDAEAITAADYPAAVVADVATDPNGSVLEVGTGKIDNIYVIVNVEGSLRIAEGGVFSFYEFEQPLQDRLTDEKWREMLGIDISFDEDGYFVDKSVDIPRPDWTSEFRITP